MNLYTFWDENYRIEDEELRVKIADAVISVLEEAGWDREKIQARKYRHPMTRRKSWRTLCSIVDVLADFIMRPEQRVEQSKEYPVKNADAEWYDGNKRRNREISYEGFEEGGGSVDIDKKVYLPKEVVMAH
ncbi:hypothetical protein [Paenibacillus sp. OAS669]|uniref:hypothetical protein n=1 Tax=Paenibacillus sp. OAS669 TaxID=2663821 RepID=UPI00178BA0C4|nr:hypothetical protein [Paenibacillus sp. OAS669]MBE1443897.1 hypothetical protein [Paenibacillus sp. OAS669]